jgi:hypothetical protein
MKYKKNKLFVAIESLIYSSVQMFLGLLLHPYRSMQLLVKNKILLPFVFYPIFIGLFFCLLLEITLISSIYHSSFLFKFFYQTTLFFCFYWQLALFYLWIRFDRAFHRF